MNTEQSPLSRSVSIINELGLHARAAAKIANLAQVASDSVWISHNGDRADAASVIDILTLACGKGSEVQIHIDSSADIDILNRIVALVENGFGE